MESLPAYTQKIRTDLSGFDLKRNSGKIEQLLKLSKSVSEIEEEFDCEIAKTNLSPAFNQAAIEVLFHGEIEANKKRITLLQSTMDLADGMNISVNPIDEEVQITFFVENIWEK